MKYIKKILLLGLIQSFLLSCYNNDFDEVLFRTPEDPFADVPQADSLSLEHTVFLSWKKDEAADCFYLMKSFDTDPPVWTCIYEGNATEYTDSELPDKDLYIYRLDKLRGEKYFTGSDYAYGFSLDGRKDQFEPNDTDSMPTLYEYPLNCNLTCVRYLTNNKTIVDCDWFSIQLKPCQTAHIVITQTNYTKPDGSTYLKFQETGKQSESIISGYAKQISNSSLSAKTAYFKIYPETTELLSGNTGIAVIQYTVSCSNWTAYSVEGGN